MKKTILTLSIFLTTLGLSVLAQAYDTPAQIPLGIAVGPSFNVEVSFPTMENPDSCAMAGAYVLADSLDVGTRKAMLSLLITAKSTHTPIRVRIEGCTDRPRITYVFMDPTWI